MCVCVCVRVCVWVCVKGERERGEIVIKTTVNKIFCTLEGQNPHLKCQDSQDEINEKEA